MSETPDNAFDLVVGTEGAGTTAALRCARAARLAALVGELPYGGTSQR